MKQPTHRQQSGSAGILLVSALLVGLSVGQTGMVRADVLRKIQDSFKRWGFFQDVQINGQNQFTFQEHSVDGSETAYENQRWDTGSLVRQTSLHLSGPIWKEFAFQADLSSSGYGPTYSRWIAGYAGHDTSVFFGDLSINLSGNEFVSFSKSLKGYQLDHSLPDGGLLRAFYSEEKGLTRNETISGNNTSGPYFLTYTPIVDGSEVVKVNEEVQKFGTDYILDYQSGQLRFEPSDRPAQIIPDTAIISVSYQSYGYGSNPGSISGFRAEMPLMDNRLLIGVSHVRQERDTARSDTVGYQEDVYQGSGSTGPFDTIFHPIINNGTQVIYKGETKIIEQALVVLVDNVEQAENVDYDSYRQIGRIIFRRAVPPTALVLIRYYYDLTTDYTLGDQSVTGIDLNYKLNKDLSLRADYGRSTGGTDSADGAAKQVNVNYSRDRLSAVLSWRDIEPDFTYLNSVGFYTKEKGADIGIKWQPHDHIRLYTRFSDLDSSQGYSFGYSGVSSYNSSSYYGGYTYAYGVNTADSTTSSSSLDVATKRREYQMNLDFPGWPTAQLSRQVMGNRGGSSGDSEMTSDQVRLEYAPRGARYSLSSSINKTVQDYLGTTDDDEPRGSMTERFDLSGRYQVGPSLSFTASLGQNKSSSTYDANTSSSDTMQLALNWAARDNLDISLDHRVSESMGRVSYYSSYTYDDSGSDGIGGGSGSYDPSDDDDEDEDTTDKYQDISSQLHVSYRASERTSLDLLLGRRKYTSGGSVGYLADSDQTTRNLSVMHRVSDEWGLNMTYGTDTMDFLQEDRGSVSNDMLSLGTSYQPRDKPYSAGLNLNLQTGSSPTYVGFGSAQKMFMVDNDLFDIQSYVNYRLDETSSIVVQMGLSDFVGGYSDFQKNNVELQYQRRLSGLATVSAGYRYIRNVSRLPQDPRLGYTSLTPPSQNYVANTFMVTLNTSFHSGLGGSPQQLYTGYAGSTGYGLGSFGGYRTTTQFSDSSYGSSYGTGYSAFQNLRYDSSVSDSRRLPGYGIFEGVSGSGGTTGYEDGWGTGTTTPGRPTQRGIGEGKGEFQADKMRQSLERPEFDQSTEQPPMNDLPTWLLPEDLWEYWPYYMWDMEF